MGQLTEAQGVDSLGQLAGILQIPECRPSRSSAEWHPCGLLASLLLLFSHNKGPFCLAAESEDLVDLENSQDKDPQS